ncbi:MAG: ABC transporter ATP-binding protein [Actinomycetota bacterium]
MEKITIENLNKNFGCVECLKGVNLQVDEGQLSVIVGPSGCGKSTLLRCIAGLETCSGGSIFIGEELINDKEPRDRNVAMVFQHYALYPHMTVRRNLSLGLENMTRLSKKEIQERIEKITNTLQITKLLDRKPGQLSGGESQRVAIGRALVKKPKIFLLDEPLSAIDAKLRRELRTEIKKIQRKFGVTTIYVTHDQEEAMALGDKIVVLCDGEIRQVGTPEEIFNDPKDQFVAGFIGSPPMNFFDLDVKKRNDKYFLENEGFIYEISVKYFERYLKDYLGKKTILGIRPSSIKIVQDDKSYTKNRINAASVTLVENFGSKYYVYLDINSKKIIAKTGSENVSKIGDKIKFSFKEEDIHLFDIDSKKTLKTK